MLTSIQLKHSQHQSCSETFMENEQEITEKLKQLVSENKKIPNMNQIDHVLKGILSNIKEIERQLVRKKLLSNILKDLGANRG